MAVAEQEILEQIKALPLQKQAVVVKFIADLKSETTVQNCKSVAERIQELMADVPENILDKLPTDGAEQHDHYIYGTPKK